MIRTHDPISEFILMTKYANEPLWSDERRQAFGLLYGRALEMRREESPDWLALYREAIELVHGAMDELENESARLATEVSSLTGAQLQESRAQSRDVDVLLRQMKSEIDKSINYWSGNRGRLAKQEEQIINAFAGAFDEFTLEEIRRGGVTELTLPAELKDRIQQYFDEIMAHWQSQVREDLPRFVPGESPALMRKIDRLANQNEATAFDFELVTTLPSKPQLQLDTLRTEIKAPKMLGQVFRSVRQAMIGISIIVGPYVAAGSYFALSGTSMTLPRKLLMAGLLPVIVFFVILWARSQKQEAIKKMTDAEHARLKNDLRRHIGTLLSSFRGHLERLVLTYFMDESRRFAHWGDDIQKQVRRKTTAEAAQIQAETKARQMELNQKLNRVRSVGSLMSQRVAPALELRAQELEHEQTTR
ncbi:MAG: hypothetical protein P9L99_11025 [Candidatus Lernaella stagnicola]|nr:hypothetical protein [Candidatus Lernaella stagnicola]